MLDETTTEQLKQLCEDLQPLLKAELEAGNRVVETSGGWPQERSIGVFLEKHFLAPVASLPPGVEFVAVNDPHWWKAEYSCEAHSHFLACKF
jgi:hypothetical protein